MITNLVDLNYLGFMETALVCVVCACTAMRRQPVEFKFNHLFCVPGLPTTRRCLAKPRSFCSGHCIGFVEFVSCRWRSALGRTLNIARALQFILALVDCFSIQLVGCISVFFRIRFHGWVWVSKCVVMPWYLLGCVFIPFSPYFHCIRAWPFHRIS
jgi:hypothetical protein